MIFSKNNDIITIKHSENSQFSKMLFTQFDSLVYNLDLLPQISLYLKEKNIKWVTFSNNNKFILDGLLAYKSNQYINCHVDDIQKFYYKNISLLLEFNNIYIPLNDDDGWTRVIDLKKEKINKLKSIKKEIANYMFDWSS